MSRVLWVILVVGVAAGCDQASDIDEPPQVETSVSMVSGGCTVVQTPPQTAGNPAFQISPRSSIASDFTRPIFPLLAKPGSWSSTQWVVDLNGLSLPAITTTGTNSGLLPLPFNSGDTVVGVTLTVCGDANTYIIGDTAASQFSLPRPPPALPLENLTDSLVGTGSVASRGNGGVWHDVDIGMEPLVLGDQSQFWLYVSAQSGGTGIPISMAVSRVLLHLNH